MRRALFAGLVVLCGALGAVSYVRLATDRQAAAPAVAANGSSIGLAAPETPGVADQRTLSAIPASAAPADLDLTHVEVRHFAKALGNDPLRIFEYVRDGIAHEVYAGSLRGPRGTLLALAANSVDRASLLASLLHEAGQKVRLVHGTLPAEHAGILVKSMWVARANVPQSAQGSATPSLSAAGATFAAGADRDVRAIYSLLQASTAVNFGTVPTPTHAQLVAETQPHYWVQWMKGADWVDLDPSFAGATPGLTYAEAADHFDALPESVFHQVVIRVQVEEHLGDRREAREVLRFSARAADLSAVDILFSHAPENWEPSPDLSSAMASAFQDPTRVTPVLIAGDRMFTGKAFQWRPPQKSGLGGLGGLLAGRGSGDLPPLATAESIEFDFIAPGGVKRTVVREVFDVLGPDRRRSSTALTAVEAEHLSAAFAGARPTHRFYSLLFSTGRIVESHLTPASVRPSSDGNQVDGALRRLAITMQAASDVMTARLMEQDKALHIYLETPRLTIAELHEESEGKVRLAIDLRQDAHRALSRDGSRSAVVFAGVARGVVTSTLERLLLDYVSAQSRTGESFGASISTSALFEAAATQQVPPTLLSTSRTQRNAEIPPDALARTAADLAAGFVIVAPERAVLIAGARRYAWWRIDPRTGDTVGVTDDGLHGSWRVLQEYIYRTERTQDNVLVVRAYRRDVFGRLHLVIEIDPRAWPGGLAAVFRWLRDQGFVPSFRPPL